MCLWFHTPNRNGLLFLPQHFLYHAGSWSSERLALPAMCRTQYEMLLLLIAYRDAAGDENNQILPGFRSCGAVWQGPEPYTSHLCRRFQPLAWIEGYLTTA